MTSVEYGMWLRFPPVSDAARLAEYRSAMQRVAVTAAPAPAPLVDQAQLDTVAQELSTSLERMLGQPVPVVPAGAAGETGTVFVNVAPTTQPRSTIEAEGFRITRSSGLSHALGVRIDANSASGALYGAFRLLLAVSRELPIPTMQHIELPKTSVRIWQMWDNLDGTIERGYGGSSVIWPEALLDLHHPPTPKSVYLAPCAAADPTMLWQGTCLGSNDRAASELKNIGTGACVGADSQDPVTLSSCSAAGAPPAASVSFEISSGALGKAGAGGANGAAVGFLRLHTSNTSSPLNGKCFDINHGLGPDLDFYRCHNQSNPDCAHQLFSTDFVGADAHGEGAALLRSVSATGMCLAARNHPTHPVNTTWAQRFSDLMRLLKSSGINSIMLNNVNACGDNAKLLDSVWLANVTRNIANATRAWGITPYFAACYASSYILDGIDADPRSTAAQEWWRAKVAEIYAQLPHFGGFVVKADSEGNQGPQAFNATEADGANMLARALAPHGGAVFWRAFVYGKALNDDRAKQAYETFMPLDGAFDTNVVVQIKNGPMDFQVREPAHPLFGALEQTGIIMEVQAAQEYTGQQIHTVALPSQWESYLSFDTYASGTIGNTVSRRLSAPPTGTATSPLSGMAAVSNIGDFANWTGSVLGGVNIFGFGRMSWDPSALADDVHREWADLVFGSVVDSTQRVSVASTIARDILGPSWRAYENYTSPLGIGFVVEGGYGGGPCAPHAAGPGPGPGGVACPKPEQEPKVDRPMARSSRLLGDAAGNDHYWLNPCSNYGYSNYSADGTGLGCQRTSAGTGYSQQYPEVLTRAFDDPATCPTELLLFFHHLPWSHQMPSPGETKRVSSGGSSGGGSSSSVSLARYIEMMQSDGLDAVHGMAAAWESLRSTVGEAQPSLFNAVSARFAQQLNDAAVFASVMSDYFAQLRANNTHKH